MYRKVVDQLTDLLTMPTIRIAPNLYNAYSFLLLWFHRKMSLRKSQGYKVKRYMHAPSSFKNKDRLKNVFVFFFDQKHKYYVGVYFLFAGCKISLRIYTSMQISRGNLYMYICISHILFNLCMCVCVYTASFVSHLSKNCISQKTM